MNLYYVYIMTNRKGGVLYTGVTNNLSRRVHEHRLKLIPGFTSKYKCTRLAYYDTTQDVVAALTVEKRIKGWLRRKKIALIESMNPEWKALSEGWYADP